MDKTAIRNFAIEARKILMKSAVTEAGFYGITKEGCAAPVQKGNDFEVYQTLAGTENRIYGDDIKRRANLVKAIQEQGFDQVIEETAYTWFNRIIAIRFMEVNNYLPTRVRVLSSETGSGTPDIITQADTVELNLTANELDRIQTAKRENKYDEAFRLLFVKQCNELNEILPGLFEKTNDYMELLLKITYTGDGVVRMLVDSIPEDNFNVETEGQVEIIGWMYQYYNTELKDDTFAKLKKNVKITKERIPAATQLFTPDWIVRYMVENALGRVWIEHLRAVDPSVDEKAKAEEFGWKYYLPEAEQEDDVAAQLVEIRKNYRELTPQDITCIDPCMGSGHILVYMFDVLMDIYRSEGFSEREAVFDILEKNIRGLDIDRRAYQLSYFALMMKARGYNRIFFRGRENLDGERVQAVPQVYAIEESNAVDRGILEYFGATLDDLRKNNALNQINGLLDSFRNAKEYGSALIIDNYDWELLREFITNMKEEGQSSLFGFVALQSKPFLAKIIAVGEILANRYDAVVTNPPYMGGANMNNNLSEYIKNHYTDYKMDLFSVFIYRCINMSKKCGYASFLSPYVWMFIASYEKLRENICHQHAIQSLIQFEYSAFEEATVPICTFVISYNSKINNGRYIKLTDFKGGMEVQRKKTLEALNAESCKYYYVRGKRFFDSIPTSPIAFWLSDRFIKPYEGVKLYDISRPCKGIDTGDNNLFLRLWFEVEKHKSSVFCGYEISENIKWIPYNKGGAYRKWYGNNDYLINWENDGQTLKGFKGSNLRNKDTYFKEGITWSTITSAKFSSRRFGFGYVFDNGGCCLFADSYLDYIIAFLNGAVATAYLSMSPTLNSQPGDIGKLPIIVDEQKIDIVETIARRNIELCKQDWDMFETSWDFSVHPIVRWGKRINEDIEGVVDDYLGSDVQYSCPIELCFLLWKEECEKRFAELKDNEEELNRIFIQIYGLQEELSPLVEEKEISIRKAKLDRDIRSFISYAVGCMFGRYSLDTLGITYAGGDMDMSLYKQYPIDQDAIIPITDESYFEDDIVGRLVEFIKVLYGEETLDKNLEYIANALDVKGNTPREKIRTYFLNDFYKDHCNVYSVSGSGRRPIYWLFDSGKQNGFKCLVYMHRYTPDMVGMIRSDYLTKAQTMIENSLRNVEYTIGTSASAVDKAQATKKRDKYIKQLAEIRAYYPALSHVALRRIDISLDDGVKVNYEKFQNIEISSDGEKKQKIDLLAKI